MMKPTLTVAVARYDRHQPLLDGRVQRPELQLHFLPVRQGRVPVGRHERMLHHREFDACEMSLSSYIMAKSRGAELTAIPIFPRRLFSHSNFYVNVDAGIDKPEDLRGKRVGLVCFQTTMSVLGKGDLQRDYGVPLDSVRWMTCSDEPVPFEPPAGVVIEKLVSGTVRDDAALDAALESGAIDAVLAPRPPLPFIKGSPRIRRLFPDSRKAEEEYFRRNGFWPLMHLVAVAEDVATRYPWAMHVLYEAFEEGKRLCYDEYMDDPNYSCLAWGKQAFEEQRRLMGPDPWVNGVAANRNNLERFIGYMYSQGLLPRPLTVEELFYPGLLNT